MLHLPQEKRKYKHISFNRLKSFIKNFESTKNQIASGKQKVDIHYKKQRDSTNDWRGILRNLSEQIKYFLGYR